MSKSILEEYADQLIKHDLDSLPEDRRSKVTEEQIVNVRGRLIKQAGELQASINNKAELWEHCRRGRLDPCNKASRMVFERTTGLKLPASSTATSKFIAEYVGSDIVDASRKAREDAANAFEKAREEKRAEAHASNIARITLTIVSAGRISGDDLIDIARHLGIDVHPRTVGSIRRNLIWIEQGQAQITNRKFDTHSAHNLLREVRAQINAI